MILKWVSIILFVAGILFMLYGMMKKSKYSGDIFYTGLGMLLLSSLVIAVSAHQSGYNAIHDFINARFTERQRASMSLDDIVRASRIYLKSSPAAKFYNKFGTLEGYYKKIESNIDTQYVGWLAKQTTKLVVPPHVKPVPVWRQETDDGDIRFIPYWELNAGDDFNQGLIAAFESTTEPSLYIFDKLHVYLVGDRQAISIRAKNESQSPSLAARTQLPEPTKTGGRQCGKS